MKSILNFNGKGAEKPHPYIERSLTTSFNQIIVLLLLKNEEYPT